MTVLLKVVYVDSSESQDRPMPIFANYPHQYTPFDKSQDQRPMFPQIENLLFSPWWKSAGASQADNTSRPGYGGAGRFALRQVAL